MASRNASFSRGLHGYSLDPAGFRHVVMRLAGADRPALLPVRSGTMRQACRAPCPHHRATPDVRGGRKIKTAARQASIVRRGAQQAQAITKKRSGADPNRLNLLVAREGFEPPTLRV